MRMGPLICQNEPLKKVMRWMTTLTVIPPLLESSILILSRVVPVLAQMHLEW